MLNNTNEFAKLCSRTTPTNLAPIKERLENGFIEYEMIMLLERVVQTLNKLDYIKKYCIYGKITPYIEKILKDAPTSSGLSHYSEKNIRVAHSVLGILTEGGEIAEVFLKHLKTGYPIDDVNFGEELGDLDWYVVEGAKAIDVPLSNIHETLIKKLSERFPDKYSDENAINRNLTLEREILEESFNSNRPKLSKGDLCSPNFGTYEGTICKVLNECSEDEFQIKLPDGNNSNIFTRSQLNKVSSENNNAPNDAQP
jgi:NTP pyrophosphatase (non-canonical NTP hydrolase)